VLAASNLTGIQLFSELSFLTVSALFKAQAGAVKSCGRGSRVLSTCVLMSLETNGELPAAGVLEPLLPLRPGTSNLELRIRSVSISVAAKSPR